MLAYYVTGEVYRPVNNVEMTRYGVPDNSMIYCGRVYTEVLASCVTKAREMGERIFRNAQIKCSNIGVMSKCSETTGIVADYQKVVKS